MSDEDVYRKRAEDLLRLAASADDMKRRSNLIDEAMYWHNLALDAHEHPDGHPTANDLGDEQEARA